VLIPCPECERQVSDRAKACPDCGFPVAEHVGEQRAAAERAARIASREHVGEIDCPRCEARGFVQFEVTDELGNTREVFTWCSDCKHSGRVHQCRDLAGYYAVGLAFLEQFLAGELDRDDAGVSFVGTVRITEHRYPQAGDPQDDEPTAADDQT
jgi:DNA-directed RNA polymerase subunit RPC12/RpoP